MQAETETTTTITQHANLKILDRGIPQRIINRMLHKEAFTAQGRRHHEDPITNYLIIRYANNKYYVGVERENTLITVIRVDYAPDNWFRRRLLSYRHQIAYIKKLPLYRETPKERAGRKSAQLNEKRQARAELTKELEEQWVTEE